MKRKSVLRFNSCSALTVAILLFLGLALILGSCSKKQSPPQEKLNVRIVSIPGQIDADAIKAIAAQYSAANPALITGVTAETTTIDDFLRNPNALLKDTDVLIFPSIVADSLQLQKEAFYPQSVTDTDVYKTIQDIFTTEKGLWAVPLTADPIVMITKKASFNLIGEEGTDSNWSKILMISSMSLDKGVKLPHVVFTTGRPEALTDSIAALEFGYGYAKEIIQGVTIPNLVEQNQFSKILKISNESLKGFMISKDQSLPEIPQVENLPAFSTNPNAIVTFARLSEYFSLSANDQSKLSFAPTAKVDTPVIPCYVVAASVPLESQNPASANKFIGFLNSKMDELAQKSHTLPVNTKVPQAWKIFVEDAIPVVRTNNKTIDQKDVLELLNGTAQIMEANKKWLPAFTIPAEQN